MLEQSKKTFKDSLIIGAALFAMFFGAGNMIFPPSLGLNAGSQWFYGFLGYYLADIGLALVAIFAQIRAGSFDNVLAPVGKVPAKVLMIVIVLCLGPIISIPRTAATTFELSVEPLIEGFSMPLFYLVFFAAVLLLTINKSAVVDIVGKVLTPVLFVGLLVLIIMGIINPIGLIAIEHDIGKYVADGIAAGYQTMDVLAAGIFGVLILNSAKEKGHTDKKTQSKVALNASFVAAIGLLVIYLGLTYLGATASQYYGVHLGRVELLLLLIENIMPGSFGVIFFAVVAGFACLSTAIALVSSAANYFANLFKGGLGYKGCVVLVSIVSALISFLGVDTIVSLAAPVLNIVYPPVLVLVLASFLADRVDKWAFRFASAGALIVGLMEVLEVGFIDKLPLAHMGLAWLVPAVVLFIVGAVVGKSFKGDNIPPIKSRMN